MNLKAKYGIPYVVAIRNTDVNVFLKKRIDLRKQGLKILKNASAIFFLSPSYRKQVLSKYVPYQMKFDIIQKSYVIPNGIDDYWIFNTPSKKSEEDLNRIQNKKIKVIYVGQIDKNKNIILTQKALSILRNKGYETEFTIVGKIKDRREYQHIIKYPYTRYMSFQSKESLIKLYRNNDIFIMPSHYETFGLVYAEAMSQGLPVIYTRNQGFDQQFKEGEVGYSVNDKKPDELSNKIQLICNNYKKISENSQNMSKKFKWSEIAQVYMNIYKSII